jgi:ATP-binding cassette subfamily F protein uup
VNLPLDKTPIEFLSDISELIVLSSDYAVTPARFLELFGFPTSFHRLPISVLSGGEKRRLYLLSTLVRNPNFLVLDEPTNDLDIDTLRRLEQYILDFNGCVISVSHDRAFLDRTCTELIIMPEARRFEGNYTDYHEIVQAQGNTSAPTAESQNKDQNRRRDHQKKGLSFKEKREFEDLTAEIEALETEKQELEDFFTSGHVDQGGQRQRRYNEIGQRLEACYPRWETLAELAE